MSRLSEASYKRDTPEESVKSRTRSSGAEWIDKAGALHPEGVTYQ